MLLLLLFFICFKTFSNFFFDLVWDPLTLQEQLEPCKFLFEWCLIFCSLWCLYVVLHILWSYHSMSPNYTLFSAATVHANCAGSSAPHSCKTYTRCWGSSWNRMLEACCTSFFPSLGRSLELHTFSQLYQALLAIASCIHFSLFSVSLRHPNNTSSITYPYEVRQKLVS